VFGAGNVHAALMLVGEVPGDQEDLEGKPFVGPAGRLLDEALEHAGIERSEVYVTNAVKHFSWEQAGKRRLHRKPKEGEIRACKPWLEAEIAAVAPTMIICLGATAAKSLLGRSFRITQHRGERMSFTADTWIIPTYHPAAILRAPDPATRRAMRGEFFDDFRKAVKQLTSPGGAAGSSSPGQPVSVRW
jgi:DNA polymerase